MCREEGEMGHERDSFCTVFSTLALPVVTRWDGRCCALVGFTKFFRGDRERVLWIQAAGHIVKINTDQTKQGAVS